MQTAIELDTRGLDSPFPIIRIKRMLQKLYPGQLLRVIATDAASATELAMYCNQTGDKLLESQCDGRKFFYTIKKKPQR